MLAEDYAANLHAMVDGFDSEAATGVIAHRVGDISNRENNRLLSQRRTVQARFDNQFTTEDNREQWALVDGLSIDAANSWLVRSILRRRARDEYHNNSILNGAANRLAKFVIGTGPRLHMSTANKDANTAVEKVFNAWAKKIRLGRKLRTSRAARVYNGEGVLLMRTNPGVDHPVKLDLFAVEADQLTSPLFGMYPAGYPDQYFDGVVLDPWGNPQTYHILRQHPGATGPSMMLGYEFDPWSARYVIHDYGEIRPGQQRGVPECVPALDIFMEARRYRKAVLGAAETAADNVAVFESEAPETEGSGQENDWDPMDTVTLKRRTATVLPYGVKLAQMKAEQPVTTYDMFTMTLLMEASQILDMPLFILTGDARLANMSSAYVATQSFIKSVQVDRSDYELHLDRVFDEFMDEARRIPGLLPNDLPADNTHNWRWDRISSHADPAKMATAQQLRLENGTSSIPRECAMEGYDWEEEQEADAKALGMNIDDYREALRQKRFAVRGTIAPVTGNPETDPVNTPDNGEENDDGDE